MQSSRYAPKPVESLEPMVGTASPPKEIKAPPPAPAPIQEPLPPVTSSYEPSYSMDPSIDEFAQTRPPDDLFDDDFTPVAESTLVYDPPPPAPAPVQEPQPFREPRYEGGAQRGNDVPRGAPRGPRGQRGGRGRGGGNNNSRSDATKTATETPSGPAPESGTVPAAEAPKVEVPGAPTGPKNITQPQIPAVRGDRTATGGLKKEKLTEEQLNAKLAAMSLKNKALQEAHEKAQADQEAFDMREKEAAARRKVERANRQVLMGEREKNRQRKLQALGGREWDAEKNEDDFKDEGRRARRGAHGGITGSRHSAPAEAEPQEEFAEQDRGYSNSSRGGRGGRGRGGRGRGRGDANHNQQQRPTAPQKPPTAADFPDLPVTAAPTKSETPSRPKDLEFPNKKKSEPPAKIETESKPTDKAEAKPKLTTQPSFGFSPATEKRSWAEEVDAASPSSK